MPAEGDLWVRSRIERSGKQIELLNAELLAQGPDGQPRPVATASGWRMKTVDTRAVLHAPAPPLRPLSEAKSRDMKKDWDRNYVHSVDWRWLTKPLAEGPGESWLRPKVDLVKGETMTPLERLFAVADDANGIGTKLDIRKWTFMNTDLVVHVHRVPEGEWIGIRAETSYGPDGIGTTLGTLFDETGPVGAIQQSVLIRPMNGVGVERASPAADQGTQAPVATGVLAATPSTISVKICLAVSTNPVSGSSRAAPKLMPSTWPSRSMSGPRTSLPDRASDRRTPRDSPSWCGRYPAREAR